MKFLLTTQPTSGHFHAMVPLARALQDGGHEVAFATGERFGAAVKAAGFRHFACGFDFDGVGNIFLQLPEWEEIRRLPLPEPVQQLYAFAIVLGPKMFEDLMVIGQTWQPDVVVRDPMEFGGYAAAEKWNIPHATVMWAFYIAPQKVESGRAILELRQRCGLEPDPDLSTLDSYLVLDFLPPSWEFPGWPSPPVTHRYCAPPFDWDGSEAMPPEWMADLPARPTVYATLGTTFNQSLDTFQAIIDALADDAVNLIVTVGKTMDPEKLRIPGDHIRVARYIPQTLLLPRCDALVFHGGYNTLLAALWCGLPMVLLPQDAGDNIPTSTRCAEIGAGILLMDRLPAPEAIRTAVRAVLEQENYRARARQLQAEMKGLPPLVEAVARLERLGRTREPQIDSNL